ncbi:protein dithiol:quinone oxidoreductase [Candidatus Xenohaliotis californiensis]|uniref:Protein dithiol:quinone oxidoreductase n=1 Tax=Candidatus Xenohaliotis californiensis TaxID=84677 RepID=A0ABP0ERL1_9RICK|nr:protein dithiol:quinone oxidoreductase [Candidatus Xenohaliotis californiensis]
MSSTREQKTDSWHIHLIHFFAALFPLIFGYSLELYRDILPCKLCLMQRTCFFVVLFSSSLGLLLHKKFIAFFSILFFAMCFMVALYNVALEWDWFGSIVVCQDSGGWLDNIFNKYNIPCNVPALEVLGISLAEINVVYCAIVVAVTSVIFLKNLKIGKKIENKSNFN